MAEKKYEQFKSGGRNWIRELAWLECIWVLQRTDTNEFLTGFDSRGPRFWWGAYGVKLTNLTGVGTDKLKEVLGILGVPFRIVRLITYLEEPVNDPEQG